MEISSHALELRRADGDPRRGRGVHQPHAGPPRLPPDDGGLLPGQAAAVRLAADARADRQRRRRLRAPAGRGVPGHGDVRARRARRTTARVDVRTSFTGTRLHRASRRTATFAVRVAAARPLQRAQRARRVGRRAGARRAAGDDRRRARRRRRACPGASSRSTRASRSPCSSTTRTRPTRWRTCCAPRASWPTGRVIAVVRRRRGPRPRQAPADGRDRRAAGRRGARHLRQPALGGPGGDHRRDPGRDPADRARRRARRGPAGGDPPRDRARRAGRRAS